MHNSRNGRACFAPWSRTPIANKRGARPYRDWIFSIPSKSHVHYPTTSDFSTTICRIRKYVPNIDPFPITLSFLVFHAPECLSHDNNPANAKPGIRITRSHSANPVWTLQANGPCADAVTPSQGIGPQKVHGEELCLDVDAAKIV